jgi:Ni/Co efflux regulator RcnB
MIKPVIALIAASGLAAKLVHHLSRSHEQRRLQHEHARHRDDVSRWEDEGGNLPAVKPPAAR